MFCLKTKSPLKTQIFCPPSNQAIFEKEPVTVSNNGIPEKTLGTALDG